MSIFEKEEKVVWPTFKWKTGNKIKIKPEENVLSDKTPTKNEFGCPKLKYDKREGAELIHKGQCLDCKSECHGTLCYNCCENLKKRLENETEIIVMRDKTKVNLTYNNLEKKANKVSKNEEKKVEVDELLEIPAGAILRIDGVEYQTHISIKENQVVDTNYIHNKVINPNGSINKWEYKTGQLKWDKEDNIFYYVIESPKKG